MTTAPGVTYHQVPGCDRQFFRCSALVATISTLACAANWRKAQELRPDDVSALHKCRTCPIGAAHSGESVVERSPIFGMSLCARCRGGTTRMIGNRLCPSCYNRNLEYAKGTNRKGTVPTFRFAPRRIGVVTAGGYAEVRDELTADTAELAVQLLRTVTGRIMFCRAIGRPPISTSELARRVEPAAKPLERPRRGQRRHRPPLRPQRGAHWKTRAGVKHRPFTKGIAAVSSIPRSPWRAF
jgi:hypothetical protein